MKSLTRIVAVAAAAATIVACSGSPAAPSTSSTTPTPTTPAAPSPAPINLVGAWTGTGQDSGGNTVVTFALTQNGAAVSGSVATSAVNPEDGSCNSCHRNKKGTVAGTLSGTTLTLTMTFAAGGGDDPTPICSSTMTGTAANAAARALSIAYSGADTCEGPLTGGILAMAHAP